MPPSFGGTAWLVQIASGSSAQQIAHVGQQQLVLENAAGKHDCIDLSSPARAFLSPHTVPERLPVEMLALFPVARGRAFGPRRRLAATDENPARHFRTERDTLLRRSLLRARASSHIAACPSKGNGASESEQGCGRIEEPPDRSGGKAAHVFVHQLQRLLIARRGSRTAPRSGQANLRSAPGIRLRPAPDVAPPRRHPEDWRAADGATRSNPSRTLPAKNSPPQMLPSSPYPVPSKLTPNTRLSHSPRSASTEAYVSAMMLHRALFNGGKALSSRSSRGTADGRHAPPADRPNSPRTSRRDRESSPETPEMPGSGRDRQCAG